MLDSGGPGEAALLIHGAYLSGEQWAGQLRTLGGRWRVLVPDLRGHGGSGSGGKPYSVRQFAWDMAELLTHLGLRRAHVCGHSLGGMVALQLTLDFPRLVHSLTLAETSYGTRSGRREALLTELTRPLLERVPVQQQALLFAQAMSRQTPALAPWLRREVAAFAGREEDYRSIWKAVTGFSARSRLGEIRVPTLVVVGEHHPRTHPQGRVLARETGAAEWRIIPRAGHLVNLDQPDLFSEALADFWTRTSAPLQ